MPIARNHMNYRVGEHHQKANLSDAEVRTMRSLRGKDPKKYTYKYLGQLFGCGASTARDIVNYYTRAGA